MAKKKHLAKLWQGEDMQKWNAWREQHPNIHPDLSGARLSDTNFSGANLSHADFSEADLNGTILRGANLSHADLSDADLIEADLSHADLSGARLSDADLSLADLINANLSDADLSDADLSDADLRGANLRGANLRGARLSEAYLSGTDLSDADLSGADLSGALLNEPSVISIDGTPLLEANLRGAKLSGVDLRNKYLGDAILRGANLSGADLSGTDLRNKDLSDAIFSGANLSGANLSGADLRNKDLSDAIFSGANLSGANLSFADLRGAKLSRTILVGTNLAHTILKDCTIYGIAAWDIQLDGAEQLNLTITPEDQPTITVDNLKIAQFIYLLLNNAEIREVIDTIGQKGVLILGRFTPERKAVLDALREKLRSLNFLPIVFDFERPTAHDFTETIMTLVGLSCFIIADITNPKSSPLELQATVPNYMTPFVPIIQEGEQPFAMFTDLQNKYHDWVLDTLLYDTPSNLVNVLERAIVKPALERQAELALIKAQKLRTRHIKDYF